ncbi:MAG: ROK family protein [Clostridiales bacterium]|nr:ROK family protein [Clostridiales bacterium]
MVRIGFDVGGTNIKAGILDGSMNIVAKSMTAFPKESDYSKVVRKMHETAEELLSECRLCKNDVSSLGIAVAGAVDVANGISIKACNLGFYDAPLKDEMKSYFPGIFVHVVNDAFAATLAEFKKGALKGCSNAMLLTIGTGIGGCVILDGKLFTGGMKHGFEPGHVTLALDGPLCTCGNKGCIETLCSATWIADKGKANAKTVIDRAKDGDTESMEIFDEYIENLSTALASLTAIFDPEIIALGGGVSLAGDFLFKPLREKVERKSFFKHPYTIVPAKLGNDAGMIGAALAE